MGHKSEEKDMKKLFETCKRKDSCEDLNTE
jgi:hypothetical protein